VVILRGRHPLCGPFRDAAYFNNFQPQKGTFSMKKYILALLCALAISAQSESKHDATPIVPVDVRLNYWRRLAIFRASALDLQVASQSPQSPPQSPTLRDLQDRQNKTAVEFFFAAETMRTACGDRYELDGDPFATGADPSCVAKGAK
jgi:hypothetical protein